MVDDEPAVARGIARQLGVLGFTPRRADCSEEAHAVVGETSIAVALVDLELGREDGEVLGHELLRRGVRVIYISGAPARVINPPTPFLQKPFVLAALEAKLLDVLGNGS